MILPDPEPWWHEPSNDRSRAFWTALIAGVVLNALVVGGLVLMVLA